MYHCNVDPINLCCWTHGVDISMDEYMEGTCHVGEAEEMFGDDDDDDYFDDHYDDYAPQVYRRKRASKGFRRHIRRRKALGNSMAVPVMWPGSGGGSNRLKR